MITDLPYRVKSLSKVVQDLPNSDTMMHVNEKIYPDVSEYFETMYQNWIRTQPRTNQSVEKFATWLGFQRAVVSHWLHGRSRPSLENARIIAEKTGEQKIFVLIDAVTNDPLLQFIALNWDRLPDDERRRMRDTVRLYAPANGTKPKDALD